ncbi:MAG: sigma-54-dependent Fis family transcriptional regulator [Alphaproteobacteria bacterium]|nr:sigma-54-dependent Fis family transcriptional regulator [Alphaproteobacteria bacterium]
MDTTTTSALREHVSNTIFEQTVRSLTDVGFAQLPLLDAPPRLRLRWARAIAALATESGRRPARSGAPLLLWLDPDHFDEQGASATGMLAWMLSLAAGSVLYLSAGWQHLGTADALYELCASYGVKLLLEESTEPAPLPLCTHPVLRRFDEVWSIASDPALGWLRRALRTQCPLGGAITLAGPAGVGKAQAAEWAHFELCVHGPKQERLSANGELRAGRWALVRGVESLEGAELRALRARILGEEPRWTPPSPQPAWEPPPSHPALAELCGTGPVWSRLKADALRLRRAPPRAILILGETGTGKELLARALHQLLCPDAPFQAIALSASNEGLVEDDLFGHVKGAASNFHTGRAGALLSAGHGILLLDEFGHLDLKIQRKLLRVLESRMVQPLGSDKLRPFEATVIAATSCDIHRMQREGRFLPDLIARVEERTFRMPPLRQHRHDISAMARLFLTQWAAEFGQPVPTMSPDAVERLMGWSWPMNGRELRNVVRRAAVDALEHGGVVHLQHISDVPRPGQRAPVLVTSHEDDGPRCADREVEGRLRACVLRIPPLTDRPASLRAAILDRLAGRPITPDALTALESQPWRGNLTELDRALEPLHMTAPGPVTLLRLAEIAPQLATPAAATRAAPILVHLFPSIGPRGGLRGLHQSEDVDALVIGRGLRSLHDALPPAGQRTDRQEALAGLLKDRPAAVLSLDWCDHVSKLSVVVRRAGRGLEAIRLPHSQLALWAGPLSQRALRQGPPGVAVPLGVAGELRLVGASGRTWVQLFLSEGPLAMEDHDEEVLARLQTGPRETRAEGQKLGPQLKALSEQDVDALVDIVMGYEGQDFKDHVWGSIPALRRQGLHTLADYLEDQALAGLKAQRLFTSNLTHRERLLSALGEAIQAHPTPRVARRRLPEKIALSLRQRCPGGDDALER